MRRTYTISETCDRFISEIEASCSPETARSYSTALRVFREYLTHSGADPKAHTITSLEAKDLINFGVWLSSERWKGRPKTAAVGTYLSAVQSWLRYVAREKLHPDLAADAERIREAFHGMKRTGPRKLPRVIQQSDMRRLLSVVHRKPTSGNGLNRLSWLRNIALVEALRSTGCRISELLNANVEDLQAHQHALRVLGKGSRERMVFFDEDAWQALSKYLRAKKHVRENGKAKVTPLFYQHSRSGKGKPLRLNAGGARLALHGYAKEARLEGKVSPHAFRHSFATLVLEKTGDLAATQDLLGHASPSTTRIYAKLASSRLRKIHNDVFSGRHD